MKLIYENDIPDMPDNVIYAEDIVTEALYLTPQGLRPRWKPNGITDNIEEWEKKAGLKGENEYNRSLIHELNKMDYIDSKLEGRTIFIDWRKNLNP